MNQKRYYSSIISHILLHINCQFLILLLIIFFSFLFALPETLLNLMATD